MLCTALTIRPSTEGDHLQVLEIEREAFGRTAEPALVDQLISAPTHTISLVADCDGKLIGHILLTEIAAPVRAMALAPLAVLPAYREMQVGTSLVNHALAEARTSGFEAVFVLGDTLYYERFGFSSRLADPFTVKWQGRNFMALELVDGALKGKRGKLAYPDAFNIS